MPGRNRHRIEYYPRSLYAGKAKCRKNCGVHMAPQYVALDWRLSERPYLG